MIAAELAACIDHTILKPETTELEVRKACEEAVEHRFASLCVMPYFVMTARDILAQLDSQIPVCTVVGFPNGAHLPDVKQLETRYAMDDGALEIDMVMNLSAFKSGRREEVLNDIESIVDIAHDRDALVKVIIETALLNDDEIRRACEIVDESGADYVKTCTGFGPGGATPEAVRLIRECLPEDMGVKASGEIRDYQTALKMLEAGADRLGTSNSVKIIAGFGT